MREFKFRVWHKKERRWLDPWAEEDPILSLKDCGNGCEVFTYSRERKSHDNLDCLMKDVVIQQYTNLKDKNGKEIYEGDILKFDPDIRDLIGGNCIYSNLGHVWIYSLADGVTISYNHPYSEMSDSWNDVVARGIGENSGFSYEVVGNIYENPELLNAH